MIDPTITLDAPTEFIPILFTRPKPMASVPDVAPQLAAPDVTDDPDPEPDPVVDDVAVDEEPVIEDPVVDEEPVVDDDPPVDNGVLVATDAADTFAAFLTLGPLVITGFTPYSDIIQLDSTEFSGFAAGALNADSFGFDAPSEHIAYVDGELRYYSGAGGVSLPDDPYMLLAFFPDAPALTIDDIVIV